jgi:pilus assembly protein CpaE
MLTGSVAVHRSKVHVLAQPNELEKVDAVNPDDIYMVINASAKGYQYVLIDVGTYVDAGAEMALQVADVIVLVTQPDVISVRDAFRRVKLLERLGIEKERLRLVVNRARKGAFVSEQDIRSNLGLPIAGTIADDPKTVEAAVNEGKLVREVNRRSEIAENISALVAMLTDEHVEEGDRPPEKDSGGGGFLGRLCGRG